MPPETPESIAAELAARTADQQRYTQAVQENTTASIDNAHAAGMVNDGVKKVAGTLGNLTPAFDYLSLAIMGAGTAFNQFDKSMGQTQGFSDQAQQVFKLIDSHKGLGMSLKSVAGALGLNIAGKATSEIKSLILEFTAAADQSLKLQKGYLGMMGASGGLGQVFRQAGTDLGSLNAITATQNEMINNLASSTGATTTQVTKFYELMGSQLPKALGDNVSGVDATGRSFNTLKDAMALAEGTGRDTTTIITDMKTAWDTYGLSGEKALQFTSRMSELSDKFGINLEYTNDFVKKNAEAFKLVSTNADQGAVSFNRWFGALKESGISAKAASGIIGEMTGKMATLTVAQKSFLSAQSGGPGGLRGAMQIENLLKQGKTDEVLQMAEKALKKQFGGKIYTQEEAQTSEFAASQHLRQRQLLKSSAFGGLATSDDSAARILDAFKGGTSPKEALTADGGLSKNLQNGETLQKASNTILSNILLTGQRQLAISSNRSLNDIQNLAGARNNVKGNDGKIHNEVEEYRARANNKLLNTSSTVKGEKNVDLNDVRTDNLKEVGHAADALIPESVKKKLLELKDKFLKATGKDDASKYREEYAKLALEANVPMTTPEASKKDGMAVARQSNVGQRATTGREVTAAAVDSSLGTSRPKEGVEAIEYAAKNGTPVQQPQNQKVEVTVKGLCINCAKPIHPEPSTVGIRSGT